MSASKRNMDGPSLPLRLALALIVLLVCGILLLSGNGNGAAEEQKAAGTAQEELSLKSGESEARPEQTASPSASSESQDAKETGTEEETITPIVYDQRSYQLVMDMIDAYQAQKADRDQIIAEDAAALKEHDLRLGLAWESIMDYWDYANARMELNYHSLPEDLPRDDSLCIVVLGFQLEPDGAMSPEMHGRCELALKAAEQYPEAFLAVTGGGTAYRNPDATEAGVMAAWFLRKGIPEERLILEDRSRTTEENAVFTREILIAKYPQVKNLVIVTSDYHLPLGCLMFTEAALLYACERGELPFTVVSNLALQGYGIYEYKNPAEQALYVRALADLNAVDYQED